MEPLGGVERGLAVGGIGAGFEQQPRERRRVAVTGDGVQRRQVEAPVVARVGVGAGFEQRPRGGLVCERRVAEPEQRRGGRVAGLGVDRRAVGQVALTASRSPSAAAACRLWRRAGSASSRARVRRRPRWLRGRYRRSRAWFIRSRSTNVNCGWVGKRFPRSVPTRGPYRYPGWDWSPKSAARPASSPPHPAAVDVRQPRVNTIRRDARERCPSTPVAAATTRSVARRATRTRSRTTRTPSASTVTRRAASRAPPRRSATTTRVPAGADTFTGMPRRLACRQRLRRAQRHRQRLDPRSCDRPGQRQRRQRDGDVVRRVRGVARRRADRVARRPAVGPPDEDVDAAAHHLRRRRRDRALHADDAGVRVRCGHRLAVELELQARLAGGQRHARGARQHVAERRGLEPARVADGQHDPVPDVRVGVAGGRDRERAGGAAGRRLEERVHVVGVVEVDPPR